MCLDKLAFVGDMKEDLPGVMDRASRVGKTLPVFDTLTATPTVGETLRLLEGEESISHYWQEPEDYLYKIDGIVVPA